MAVDLSFLPDKQETKGQSLDFLPDKSTPSLDLSFLPDKSDGMDLSFLPDKDESSTKTLSVLDQTENLVKNGWSIGKAAARALLTISPQKKKELLSISSQEKKRLLAEIDKEQASSDTPIRSAIKNTIKSLLVGGGMTIDDFLIKSSPESLKGAAGQVAMQTGAGLLIPGAAGFAATLPERLAVTGAQRLAPEVEMLAGPAIKEAATSASKVIGQAAGNVAAKFGGSAGSAGNEADPSMIYLLTGGKYGGPEVMKKSPFVIPQSKIIAEEATETVMHSDLHNAAMKTIIDKVRAGVISPPAKLEGTVTEYAAKLFAEGKVSPTEIPELVKHGFGPNDGFIVGEQLLRTTSKGGLDLNPSSQLSKLLNELGTEFIQNPRTLTAWEVVKNYTGSIIGTWQSFLTSLPTTATRNFGAWNIRNISELADNGVEAVLTAAQNKMTGKAGGSSFIREALAPIAQDIESLFYRLGTKGGREELIRLVESNPLVKKMVTQPIEGEITKDGVLRGLSHAVTTLNRAQEYPTRLVSFYQGLRRAMTINRHIAVGKSADGKLITRALKVGEDITPELWSNISMKDRSKLLFDATKHAMEMTMAGSPTKGGGMLDNMFYHYLKWVNDVPPLKLIYAFPRFLYNSAKYTAEHNPAFMGSTWATRGLIKGIGKVTGTGLMAESPIMTTKELAKVITGTAQIGAFMALRESKYAGEKWYEIKPRPDSHPDERVDMRPYYMISAPLFFADVARRFNLENFLKNRKDEISRFRSEVNQYYSMRDITEGITSINRIAGTSAIIAATVEGQNPDKFFSNVADMLAEFLGGFGRPGVGVKEFLSVIMPEEGVMRDTRGQGVFGPLKASIPFLSRKLPPVIDITTGKPKTVEHPIVKQAIGPRVYTKSPMQQEMERVGLKTSDIKPGTGSPAADTQVKQMLGDQMDEVYRSIVQNPVYQQMPSTVYQKLHLKDQINRRKSKIVAAILTQKGLVFQSAISKVDPELRNIMERAANADDKTRAEILGKLPAKQRKELMIAVFGEQEVDDE